MNLCLIAETLVSMFCKHQNFLHSLIANLFISSIAQSKSWSEGFESSNEIHFSLFFSCTIGQVNLEATADDPGCVLRAPTADAGLAPFCKDTFSGKLKLQIWERTRTGSRGKVCGIFHIMGPLS